MEYSLLLFCKNSENWDFENNYCTGNCYPENVTVQFYNVDTQKVQMECRASVSGRMDVIYVRILLPYAEKFDPRRMTYVQLLSVTSV